jgi:hypothetical protein
MTDKTASDWIENTGTVPAGVGPDTRIEVEYGDGEKMVWGGKPVRSNVPQLWTLGNGKVDVIRFRFLDAPASAAAQAGGAE